MLLDLLVRVAELRVEGDSEPLVLYLNSPRSGAACRTLGHDLEGVLLLDDIIPPV